jgi:predicted permease
MFALVDAVALRKLDLPDPDSLFTITALRNGRQTPIPYPLFERLRENLDVADSMCAADNTFVPVTHNGRTETVFTQFVTDDYYETMGARPLLGRTFTPADDGLLAVISDAYWRRMGRDPAVIGKVIRAGSVPLTVVGVVPMSAEFWRFAKTDVVVPIRIAALIEGGPPESVFRLKVFVTARLKKGVTLTQVQHRLDVLWPRLLAETIPPGQSSEEWTRASGSQARVSPGSRGLIPTDDGVARTTIALLVLAGLAALAASSNLAGLLFSRGLSRQREYAVRMALGATRADILGHALAEVVVLFVFGAAGTILLAGWLTRLCSDLLSFGGPLGDLYFDYGVRVDGRVVAFALAAALATAAAAQIIPALRLSRVDVGDALRLGLPSISARFGARRAMLAVQVALALALVSGSVLFARTVQLLARVDGGFRTESVLVVSLAGKVPYAETGPEFFLDLLARVRAIPSVVSAGLASRVPMWGSYNMDERITASYDGSIVETRSDSGCVWPGFFEALRIPVVAGRDFAESDRNAIIITRALAHRLFPGADPLGRYVAPGHASQARSYPIIGVIGDVRFRSPRQQETRMFFVPCAQVWNAPQTRYAMALVVRAVAAQAGIEAAVRREIDAMGKQAIFEVVALEGLVAKSTWNESIMATIATSFGTFTLLLTCVGVYALIDMTAAARRRELGIRMALGADHWKIVRFMLRDVSFVLVLGASVGLFLAVVIARVYGAFLYGTAEFEPILISAAAAIVALFALLAALLPAWRAAGLDPGSVLRHDA